MEARQKLSQGHVMMAVLATLWQAIQALTTLARGEIPTALLSAAGLIACLGAIPIVRYKLLPEDAVPRLAVPAACLWLTIQLMIDLGIWGRVAPSTYFNYLIVVTLAFSMWRVRQAVPVALGMGLPVLLAGVLGRGTDLLVLNSVMFTAGLIGYMSVYSRRLREAQHRAEKARVMLVRDQVTGLLNREAAEAQVENMQNDLFPDPTPLAVILLEVEHLAQINEQYGYGSGDRTLQMVSIVLLRQCGPQDILARWSGTRFLVTLRNANRREAEGRLEQMLHNLNAEAWPGGPLLSVRAGLALLAEGQTLGEVAALARARLEATRPGDQSPAPDSYDFEK